MEVFQNNQKGQSLIELIIAMALSTILIPTILASIVASREGRAQSGERLEASFLIEEATEAVLAVKKKDWQEIENNGTFHPVNNNNFWSLVSGEEDINGFKRKITISDVNRNSSGTIVDTGGTLDPSTKKIKIEVAWTAPYDSSLNSVIYLTRYKTENFIDTTEEDFNKGIKTHVTVTKTGDGEVVLGSGGYSNWCEPNLSINPIDLPKSGVANAVSATIGKVYAGTGENSAGVSFADVLLSDTYPPIGTVSGTFDGYKTNGIFGKDDYAYITTDNHGEEVVIIDTTSKDENGKYKRAGWFDAPPNSNGKSVYVSGNIGFMTEGNMLYTFDLTEKTDKRNKLGEVALSGNGMSVKVNGDFAYVATDSTDKQLDIVKVTDGGTVLNKVGWAKLKGLAGKDVVVNESSTKAYVVTKKHVDPNPDNDKKEFFIIDLSASPANEGERTELGSVDSGDMDPRAVTLATNNKAVMVGHGGEEYQVIDIGSDSNPSRCNGLNIDSGINGASTVLETDGEAYTYIITGDAEAELKIIAGGPGGTFSSSGTFESRIFDATNSAAFNKFQATVIKPSSTDLTFQIGIANSDDCETSSYAFVGPDGTDSSRFPSLGGVIPFYKNGGGYENPGRCMRYKAFLSSTDSNQSPILSDITINYSP